MNLAPDTRVGDVSERRKIDRRDKFSAHAGQNNYHVRAICRNIVESVHKLCMILGREVQGTAVFVEFGNQYAVCVSSQPEALVSGEITCLIHCFQTRAAITRSLLCEYEGCSYDSARGDGVHDLKRAGVDYLESGLDARVDVLAVRVWGDVAWCRLELDCCGHLVRFHVVGSMIVSESESMSGSQQYFPSALTIKSQGRAPTLTVATCSYELVSYTMSLLAVEIGTTANLPSGVIPTVFTTFCPKPMVFSF